MGSFISILRRLKIVQLGYYRNQCDNCEEAASLTRQSKAFYETFTVLRARLVDKLQYTAKCNEIASKLCSESAINETQAVEIKKCSDMKEQERKLLDVLIVGGLEPMKEFLSILYYYNEDEAEYLVEFINNKLGDNERFPTIVP
ncbi:uncharacterized protein TRIADDRAFT_52879 [Trichoplax adhaerens]|uniref:CARD domain-containing protein n=1 Tax=Trichoplax adhaerens TaxID=10228 RepID=B3RMP8_TRIAD|nr:predicted protein [Trichoplax adhaerens]EDV27312.1 predicted protein [Trichoplax adhaerens]|eukprot:XP_002109146.1 predicted protein [Trichoplax adhaerens]